MLRYSPKRNSECQTKDSLMLEKKVDVPFLTGRYKNGQKVLRIFTEIPTESNEKRKERTKIKAKPYQENNREYTRHREQMGASIGSTMTTSGLALPCSVSEQELSPEGNTGYPNASDNK